MQKVKELDLGNSDFKSIIANNNYYVDKSMLIREIIKIQKQVILLPRPRRFGKTLNLSMLKYYFDIRHPENQMLFHGLEVWQTETDIKEKQAKYPVIYLSFKDAKKDTWADTLALIKIEIARLFREHSYLLESPHLSEIEKKEFISFADRSAKDIDFELSIRQLSSFLHRFHQEKCVILIDEYDTPIQAAYRSFYEESVSFMRNLMSGAYKDNEFLYKGVITGILRVSRESIFTGLNNVSVFSILEDEFSDKFGFTEQETKQILSDFHSLSEYENVKKWYNGYKFGDTTDIYNPWSILNYVLSKKKNFKPFWVNTSSDELLKERLKERDADYTREQLLKLINNESIEKQIDENFVFPDMDTDKELLWTLLTFSGYLTIERNNDENNYTLKIPNYEIKYVFKNIILKWLSVDLNIRKTLLEETAKYLVNNEIQKFEKGFKQIMGDTFSYFDTNSESENIYQSYVLGLLAIIGDHYIIRSNRESGDGRYDILLIPHDKTKYGVVIEIKQLANKSGVFDAFFVEKLNKKIEEARAQIENNQYYRELLDHKVSRIVQLPIVFVGKQPFITPIVLAED